MNIDPYIVLGSALVGFLVGLTGAGGGALMTPMLILLFNVKPSTAISSDLVAAVFMRPFGAAVHMTKRTVNFRLGRLDGGWIGANGLPRRLSAPSHGACRDIAGQHREGLGRRALGRGGGHGDPIHSRPSGWPRTHGGRSRARGPTGAHRGHRHGRRPDRRHDLGRFRVA